MLRSPELPAGVDSSSEPADTNVGEVAPGRYPGGGGA